MSYIPLIGLEIHVQLNTKTKLFCSCARLVNDDSQTANTSICPVCLALPGGMPYLSKKAVEKAVKIGLGLHCTPNTMSIWDRKNYTYPDLFSGYQISQLQNPINLGGYVDISNKRIRINRAHLENNAAKSLHSGNNTQIDANKSGTPLVEIVSEPDLRNAVEAREYAEKVREIVRWVDASDADMYLGEMKFDINISLCVEGDPDTDFSNCKFTPIVEVKNRNSFKELVDVINYEIKKQTEEYDKTKILYTKGSKKTLGWDETKGITYILREKEEADDYRYFHEPDVPPVILTAEWIDNIKKTMPDSMDTVIENLISKYKSDYRTTNYLVQDRDKYKFFQECLKLDPQYAKSYINFIAGDISGILAANNREFSTLVLLPKTLVDVISQYNANKINLSTAKDLLKECIENDTNLNIIQEIQSRNLGKVNDISFIEDLVKNAITVNPKVVEDIKSGKENAKMFIVGIVMRESKGKADVNTVKAILEKKLKD